MMWLFHLIMLLGICCANQVTLAAEHIPTEAEKEAWFNDDAEFLIEAVNEGKLTFLGHSEKAALHRSVNHIKILSTSTKDGWVEMAQCHSGLDAVPLAQLIFPEYIIRQLIVTKKKGIGEATVEGNSVQMVDLSRGASLCITMQINALHNKSKGKYVLNNGPYQRRFLDGYYPMSIELRIDYSESDIKPVAIYPEAQPGMNINDSKSELKINASFEGVLRTKVRFSQLETHIAGQEDG